MTDSAAVPRSVRLYLVSFLIVGLAMSMLGPALTDLRERSGADIGDIGILFVGQSAGYIVGSFTGGRLFDRFNSHRVFAGSLLLLGAGLALVPSFDALNALFVTFVVIGFGGSICDLGGNTLLMWRLGAGSGRAMNLLHLCFGIGALMSPLVVHIGLAVATRTAAVGCVVLAVWSVRTPGPSRPRHAREEHTDTTLSILLLLFLFFFLYVGLEVGFAGWITTYGEEIGLTELSATWLTTVFWLGFTGGRLLASAIAHRVRPETILYSACAASVAAAMVMIAGGGTTAIVWTGTAMMGLATAPQFPGMMTLAESRIHISGSATSWFVGGAGAGGLVFPFVIGRFFDAQGADALPVAAFVLAVATFGAFMTANRALSHSRRPALSETVRVSDTA
jgi:MFS transporter, FHS family, Na+ dependent glucose transporter 1